MLNLVWCKYRGVARYRRAHSDTKCFEQLRRVVSFVFKLEIMEFTLKASELF